MSGEIKEINNEILRITQSVIVQVPEHSKFGGYDGHRDIYTMDIAKALYFANYRKQSEGEWENVYNHDTSDGHLQRQTACSVCGYKPKGDINAKTPYCPNCGAKMRGE